MANFFSRKVSSRSVAVNRLQMIITHQGSNPRIQQAISMFKDELLKLVAKHFPNYDKENIEIHLESKGDKEVLEVNVIHPGDS